VIALENNKIFSTLDFTTGQMVILSLNNIKNPIHFSMFKGKIVYSVNIYSHSKRSSIESGIYMVNTDGTGKRLITYISGTVTNMIVDPNNKYILINSGINTSLFNISSHKLLFMKKNIHVIKFSPNGNYLLLSSNKNLEAYYISNKQYIILNNNINNLYNIKWYPTGGYIFYEETNKSINQASSLGHKSTLGNNISGYSLFSETESSTVTNTVVKNTNGVYYISTNGNYLVVETQINKNNLIYIINLIQNTSILPFSL
jgi:uncharacterized protein with WD repeat